LAKVATKVLNDLNAVRVSDLRDKNMASVAPDDVVDISVTKDTYAVPTPGAKQPIPTAPISEVQFELRRTPPRPQGPLSTRPAAPTPEWQFVNDPNDLVDSAKVAQFLAQFNPLRADAYLPEIPNNPIGSKYTFVLTTHSKKYSLELRLNADPGAMSVAVYEGLPFLYKPAFLDALVADLRQGVEP
jgi:hypothetical protein